MTDHDDAVSARLVRRRLLRARSPRMGVKSLRYFGEHLVAFRGEDGAVRVLDALLRAHGRAPRRRRRVVGRHHRCPFHAWRYGGAGECVEIPYAKKIPPKARAARVDGARGQRRRPRAPRPRGRAARLRDPRHPRVRDATTWLPWATEHLPHQDAPARDRREPRRPGALPARAPHRDRRLRASTSTGHTATQRVKGRASCPAAASTASRRRRPTTAPATCSCAWTARSRTTCSSRTRPSTTASSICAWASCSRSSATAQRTEGYVGLYMANLKAGFEDDIRIWENKLYREQPVLCDGDGPISQLRRWYRQFYRQGGADAE